MARKPQRTPHLSYQIERIVNVKHPRDGWVNTFTHRELAQRFYGTEEPTAAQLSAVRRATARLVGEGRIARSANDNGHIEDEPAGRHTRTYRGEIRDVRNPRPYTVFHRPIRRVQAGR